MSHAPLGRLGDVVDIFDGPHATPKKTSSGPIFLGISNLNAGRLNLAAVEHLDEEDFARWTRRVQPQAGDLVFSYETRLGEAALIPEGLRCCLGRRMGLLRARPHQVHPRFLLYAYLSPEFQDTLRKRTVHGSTVDRIPLIEMPEFPIRLPPLTEQRAIASVLGALDDKIELNRRMSETLEELSRTIFKSWFIDFDPVRANAEGRQPVGMDAETAALFPSHLVESELGEMPEGWSACRLADIASVQHGWPFKSEHFSDELAGGPIVVSIGNFDYSGGFRFESSKLKEYRGEFPSAYVLRPGEILLVMTCQTAGGEILGIPARIPRDGRTYLHNQRMGRVLINDERFRDGHFLYRLFLTASFNRHLVATASGTKILHTAPSRIESFAFAAPTAKLMNAFSRVAGPLFEMRESHAAERANLAELRDLLLPKLISGELRVPTVEKMVEAAL